MAARDTFAASEKQFGRRFSRGERLRHSLKVRYGKPIYPASDCVAEPPISGM